MTAALVVCCVAVALLVWPSTAAARRVERLIGASSDRRQRPRAELLAVVAVPVVGALVGLGAGIAAVIVVAVGLVRRRRARRDRQRAERDAALCRALTVMAAEMSVGAPMVRACRAAAEELSGPGTPAADAVVAGELVRIAARVELGGGVDPAAVPADPPGLRRVGEAWAISVQHGLPMVALLEALRADLVQRKDFTARTDAGLAGPRATAMVLAGLPLLGLGLGQLMGAAPLAVLLGTPLGSILLVLGVGLAAAGVLWADAIVAKAKR
ncbi:type II secretion system F family protein [Gordonia alkaliphila]|uniref:Type II secretion system protein GspF domain-containing protein n=1 Tax=Gordonia alkaliphila TaxID=1053547 RepID=A0ABP8YWV9_9ACTN|nr:type II secretion system F family protein [Gordonia alkaliphila]MCK0439277.1 type II secretion system F family protein [Gordonia alkaliphila]